MVQILRKRIEACVIHYGKTVTYGDDSPCSKFQVRIYCIQDSKLEMNPKTKKTAN